jgi:lysophospholipase L1-like esterase
MAGIDLSPQAAVPSGALMAGQGFAGRVISPQSGAVAGAISAGQSIESISFSPRALTNLVGWFGPGSTYTASSGLVSAVSDLSATGGNWTASGATKPWVDPAALTSENGQGLYFDSLSNQKLFAPAGTVVNHQDFCFGLSGILYDSFGGLMIGGANCSDGNGSFLLWNNGGALSFPLASDLFVYTRLFGTGQAGYNTALAPSPYLRLAIIVQGTATTLTVSYSVNGGAWQTYSSTTTLPATNLNTWYLGGSALGKDQQMHVVDCIIAASQSGSNLTRLQSYLNRWSFTNTIVAEDRPFILWAGDSIMRGVGLNTATCPPGVATKSLYSTKPVRHVNYAVAGYTIAQSQSQYTTYVPALYSAGRSSNVYVAGVGTNSLYFTSSGVTVAQAFTQYVSLCQTARAAGWKVVAATILPRSDTQASVSPTFEADRQSFNAAVLSTALSGGTVFGSTYSRFADAVADPASDSTIGQQGQSDNTTYYQDKVHPTAAGAAILANYYATAIQGLI